MLELRKDGETTLQLKFDYRIPYGKSWWIAFDYNCSTEHETELLYAHLRAAMDDKIKFIRSEAYEQGWSDKSAKKRKQDWFSGDL